MRYLIVLLVLTGGCAMLTPNDNLSVPGVFDRALAPPIFSVPQTPLPAGSGVQVSDVNVAAMDKDLDTIARLRLAQYNGQSVDAALTQALLSTSVGVIGLAGGPVAAAGGVGITSLLLQHIFTIINTPAKANAYLDFINRNQVARDAYYTTRAAEACGMPIVPGDTLTPAGAQWLSNIGNSQALLDKAIQMSMPTPEMMQAVATAQFMKASAMQSLADCQTVAAIAAQQKQNPAPPPTPAPSPQSSTKPTAKSMNQLSLSRFPKTQ